MYDVKCDVKRVWKIGNTVILEQVSNLPKIRFDVCSPYALDEEKLRQLHATIGQCLTDLTEERLTVPPGISVNHKIEQELRELGPTY